MHDKHTASVAEGDGARWYEEEGWTTSIDVSPFSLSHDAAQLRTSPAALARHLAILWERKAGRPTGRAATPELEAQAQAAAATLRAALRPVAVDVIGRLEADLNRWFASILEFYPTVRRLSGDQVWRVLEHWPPDRALELLSVPAVQDHIASFRKDVSKTTRNRLRRAFARLAVAPGKRGRRMVPAKRLTAADREQLTSEIEAIRRDVLTFRQSWKGDLLDSEAIQDAQALLKRYCPLSSYGSQLKTARMMIEKSRRPARVAEVVIKEAKPELTIPAIRAMLQASGRAPRAKRTKQLRS